MVPLTAQKVYQLLGRNRNLNAVPEGRVVTQGIAAVTGFTLGLTKAIGATLLYDIITANITENGITNSTQQPVYVTQEICFNSRNARSLYEAEAIAEAYSQRDEPHNTVKLPVRKSNQQRLTKPQRHRKNKINKRRKTSRPQRIKVIRPTSQTATAIDNTAAVTAQTTPVTATGTAGMAETTINNGENTATTSTTTTSTDNDKTVTCIVLQKPKLKK